MRKQLFYFIIVVAIATLSSMKPDTSKNFVKFGDNLFVSKFEVTNGEYKQFINYLKESHELIKVENFLPDSNQWTEKFDTLYNAPYVDFYHWHPAYDNYPIVNISKEAIDNYCSWLTERYNSNQKRKYKKVVFRLPTEKEWVLFSSPLPGHKLPWDGSYPDVIDKKSDKAFMLANIKVMDSASGKFNYNQDGALISCKIGSYKPNKIGIYDIIGNVAELTSDNKIKGGSWDNTLEECLIDKTQDYTLPDPRVGFRLVMEIIEK